MAWRNDEDLLLAWSACGSLMVPVVSYDRAFGTDCREVSALLSILYSRTCFSIFLKVSDDVLMGMWMMSMNGDDDGDPDTSCWFRG